MNRASITFLSIILVITLSLRFYFFFHSQKEYADGEDVTFETTILSDVKVSGSFQRFHIRQAGRSEPLFISLPRFPEYSYGDTLTISGTVVAKVINNKKVIYSMYFPSVTRVQKRSFLTQITDTRNTIVRMFEHALPPDSSALLLGIVFGIKRPMTDSLKDSFQATGLLHVIAASGMNITMLGGFLSGIFAYFFNRRYALILTLLGIFYYAVLSGLEASIVRAAIMGSIAYGAKILGRQSISWYSLLVTGIVMLFLDPQLLYDVGFQLSFLATSGLIFIPPLFESLKKKLTKFLIGEDFITTLSAQIATMPLLLLYFGTISITSIVVNTIVLWTVPILMVIGGVAAVIGLLFEPLARIILFLTYPLLLYFETIPKLFGTLGILNIESVSVYFVFGYYFLLAGLLSFMYSRRKG